eukprot:Rmarinus@m.27145
MEWFVILSALFLSIHGYRRKSLSLDGTVVAFVIALLVFDAGLGVSFPLLAFYLSSKQVTKLGASKKLRLEEDYVVGGQRSAWQVLAQCSELHRRYFLCVTLMRCGRYGL